MNKKSQKDSINARLVSLSKNVKVPFQSICTSFLIERLMARLVSDKNLAKALVFKGGYVGLRVYESPRYTIDLDALLLKSDLKATLAKTKAAAENDIGDCVWFKFENQQDLKAQGEYGGVRQVYRCGIGEPLKDLKRAQIVHFDLGIGDPITPGPIQKQTKELLGVGDLSWQVYPIETVVAEKLHALVERGDSNSRSKDVFDLSKFLSRTDPKILKQALEACFKYRETNLPSDLQAHLSKIDTTRLKAGWKNAVGEMSATPSFEECFNTVVKELARISGK